MCPARKQLDPERARKLATRPRPDKRCEDRSRNAARSTPKRGERGDEVCCRSGSRQATCSAQLRRNGFLRRCDELRSRLLTQRFYLRALTKREQRPRPNIDRPGQRCVLGLVHRNGRHRPSEGQISGGFALEGRHRGAIGFANTTLDCIFDRHFDEGSNPGGFHIDRWNARTEADRQTRDSRMVPLLVSLRRLCPSDELGGRSMRDQLALEGLKGEDRCPFEVRRGSQLRGHRRRLRRRRGPLQTGRYPSAVREATGDTRLALNDGAGVDGHKAAGQQLTDARVVAQVPAVLEAFNRRMA